MVVLSKVRPTLGFAGFCLVLAGCNAATLNTMNDRLDSLVLRRAEVREQLAKPDNAGSNFDMEVAQGKIESELEMLADEAAAEIPRASEPGTRLGFHFVRVRASFKAGVKEDESFLQTIVPEAQAACAAFTDSTRPARDCAFINTADALAVIDGYVREADLLKNKKVKMRLPVEHSAAIETVVMGLRQQFCKLVDKEKLLESAPADFKTYFDLQQRRTIMNIAYAANTMDTVNDTKVRSEADRYLKAVQPLRDDVSVVENSTIVLPSPQPLSGAKKMAYCAGVRV